MNKDELGSADTRLDLATPESLRAVALDTAASPTSAPSSNKTVRSAEAKPAGEPASGTETDDDSFKRQPPLRNRLFVGAAMAACLTILAVATMRATPEHTTGAAPTTNALVVAAPPPPSPPSPAKTAEAPVAPTPAPAPVLVHAAPHEPAAHPIHPTHAAATPAAAPAPAPKTATIRLAPNAKGKPLVVDGKRAKSSSVVVACGAHTVAVGKEKPHKVDAPCGETVVVAAKTRS